MTVSDDMPLAARLGISSCLLGEEVRYDGGHKHDRYITGTLGRYFEFVPVCPELAIGPGLPREPIQLRGSPEDIRVIGVRDPSLDVTGRLRELGSAMAREHAGISGYIFKSRSPSCGMERVKLYPPRGGMPSRDGVGQNAAAFMAARPELPVEEQGRLHDPVLRENFIERVFVYRRWQDLARGSITAHKLIDFHSRHKLAILAHDQVSYRKLGRMLADAGKWLPGELGEKYISGLMSALRKRATRRNHANVLQHLQGYLKQHLDRDDKDELATVIERYRVGQLPLIVPITLLKHHFRRHPDPYVARQTYFNPHPPELMLRNAV